MPAETGFPRADVENDFLRARRRQVLARLAHRLRREPDDSNFLLPLDEVVGALGRRGQRQLGLRTIRLDMIVGSGPPAARFRPALPAHLQPGAVPLGAPGAGSAARRAIPPIEVYRVDGLHFVIDGHHRVSIAAATGQETIDAYVTEVLTAAPAKGIGASRAA